MAAGVIRVNEQGLLKASKSLKKDATEFESLIRDMENIINSLEDSWQGDAASAYAHQFKTLKPGLKKTKKLIDDIAVQIDKTLKAVQDLDTKIAGQFK